MVLEGLLLRAIAKAHPNRCSVSRNEKEAAEPSGPDLSGKRRPRKVVLLEVDLRPNLPLVGREQRVHPLALPNRGDHDRNVSLFCRAFGRARRYRGGNRRHRSGGYRGCLGWRTLRAIVAGEPLHIALDQCALRRGRGGVLRGCRRYTCEIQYRRCGGKRTELSKDHSLHPSETLTPLLRDVALSSLELFLVTSYLLELTCQLFLILDLAPGRPATP